MATEVPGPEMSPVPEGDPLTERTVAATYTDYAQAQRAVDFLSDEKFPVEHVSIVGVGLKLVETVTGRLDWGRAALSGALSGLWIGVLIAWFVAIFSEGSDFWVILLAGAIWGLVAGLVYGVVLYALSGGRRDFVSHQQLLAERYDVMVDNRHLAEARTVLDRLT